MTGHEQTTVDVDYAAARARPISLNHSIELSAGQRRRKKFRRFLALETTAFAILIAFGCAGISERFADASLTRFFEIATVVAAFAVGLIPVIFYGLPRREYPIRKSRR